MANRFLLRVVAAAFVLCCMVTTATAAGRTAKEYTIDLDLAPEDRFSAIVPDFNATVWKFYDNYFKGKTLLLDGLYLLVDKRGPEPREMQLEIEGLAKVSKLPVKFVQGVQMLYELQTLMVPVVNVTGAPRTALAEDVPHELRGLADLPNIGCTGIIAEDSSDNNSVNHARNLDFTLPGVPSSEAVFKDMVYVAIFQKNGKEIFRSQMIAGYVQVITAMRKGTGDGYTVERNTRYGAKGANKKMLEDLANGAPLNGWILRKVLEDKATFGDAVSAVSASTFASTEYTIMSGVKKGVILSMEPAGVAHTQTLGQVNFEQPPSYIIMTNFDFFWHDLREWFDPTGGKMFRPRRIEAQKLLNQTGPLTPSRLFDTISAPGVVADTVFQAIMNVEKGLWNVTIPA